MLIIKIPAGDYFDEKTGKTIESPEYVLHMEHSLVSISKWEAEWEKPFLDEKATRSDEETLSYIKHMTFEQNIPDRVFKLLSTDNQKKIEAYIEKKMTATWFRKKEGAEGSNPFKPKEIITSEVIYYWMVELNIPVEFQKWHINRLLTLIKVCNEKHKEASGDKKMSKAELNARYAKLNMERRARAKSKG